MTTADDGALARDPFSWVDARPFFQAGLQGYSDASMRLVARRLGAPYCVTEALADHILLAGGKGVEAARLDPEDHPIAGQLIGREPETMARAARVLVGLGYDVIDVNLACPVKRVRGSYRGGHLMLTPDVARDILGAVRAAVGARVPITVKMRRGTDDSPQALRHFHRIFEAVMENGYHAATVHARTVAQKYEGPSRWSFLKQLVRDYPGCTIFGSGDIFEAADIDRMLDETGVRAVSVARGAIGNPWIFRAARELRDGRESSPPTLIEQRRALMDYCELAIRFLGEKLGERRLRKVGIMLGRRHSDPAVRLAFCASKDLSEWLTVVEKHYPNTPTTCDLRVGR